MVSHDASASNVTRRRLILAAAVVAGALFTLIFVPRREGQGDPLILFLGMPGILKPPHSENTENQSTSVPSSVQEGVTSPSNSFLEPEKHYWLNVTSTPIEYTESSRTEQTSIDLPSGMFPGWDGDAYLSKFYGGDIDRSFWSNLGVLYRSPQSLCKLGRVQAALESGDEVVRLLFIGCSMSQGVNACGRSSRIEICPGCRIDEDSSGSANGTCSTFEGCVRTVWYRWLKRRYPKADLRPRKVGCKRGCNAVVAATSLNSDLRSDGLWPLRSTDLVLVDLSACEIVADGVKLDDSYRKAQITTLQKLAPAAIILALHAPRQIPGFSNSGLKELYQATAEATDTPLWAWQSVAEKMAKRLARTGPGSWPHPHWPLHFLIADFMAILWNSEVTEQDVACDGIDSAKPSVSSVEGSLGCDDLPPERTTVFSADALLTSIREGTAGIGWGTNGGRVSQTGGDWNLVEERPDKPGWVAATSRTSGSLEFTTLAKSNSSALRLEVFFLKSYEGRGAVQVRLCDDNFTTLSIDSLWNAKVSLLQIESTLWNATAACGEKRERVVSVLLLPNATRGGNAFKISKVMVCDV
ncbi:hypothetical protein FOZ61_007231 [Perkinsus olseni]|uniref:Uncharacterized protein n=1 Tax=Perkinsus olseni TaxID=32597 RepID=A0A7J6L9Y0_PEROL|nr:hypothetical protein FOZ61_007231 [Perkinsus olseni]